MEQKIAGIACDNYKLNKYKRKLKRSGFDFEVKPLTENTSLIQVKCEQSEYSKIGKICKELELSFKRSN